MRKGDAETISTNGDGFNRFIINGSSTYVLQSSLLVNDSLNIRSGTLDVGAGNDSIYVMSHWTNSGTLDGRNGVVYFNGTDQLWVGSS